MKVHEAIGAAKQHLADVFPEAAVDSLRVEGVERSDDERFWKVMFSYPRTVGVQLLDKPLFRDYRTVRLRDVDGGFMGAVNGLLSDAA